MRIPDPKANTTTEAYLAYKAGYLEESELKPVLYEPYLHFDAWLAYWAGLTTDYPVKNVGKNLFNKNAGHIIGGYFETNGRIIGEVVERNQIIWLPCKPNTNYVLKSQDGVAGINIRTASYTETRPEVGVDVGSVLGNGVADKKFKTPPNAYYIVIRYQSPVGTIIQDYLQGILDTIQVEESSSSTASAYEPYSADPEMLCDEEALVAYLSGVTDTYPEEIKDPYDVRIVGYLKYLVSARWGRPEYPVNNEEFYLSTMKPPVVPSGDTPSSDIEMDDTAEAPFVDLKMYGDTSQNTCAGDQLLTKQGFATPVTDTNFWGSFAQSKLKHTPLADGWAGIEVKETSGSVFGDMNINQEGVKGFAANTTYTIIVEIKDKSGAGTDGDNMKNLCIMQPNSIRDAWESSSVNIVQGAIWTGGTNVVVALADSDWTSRTAVVVATTKEDLTGVYSCRFFTRPVVPAGTSFKIRVSVIAGDHSSDWQNYAGDNYQPYVGGIASPNPDYPQAVQTVTGEQMVAVYGKNVVSLLGGSSAGVTGSVNGDGSITISGTATLTGGIAVMGSQQHLKAGTYTMTISKSLPFLINFSIASGVAFRIPAGGTSVTTTLAEDYINHGVLFMAMTAGTTYDETFNLQIVAGSTPDYDFVPYRSQSYTINLGKNLFDQSNATQYRYLIDATGAVSTSTNPDTYAGLSYIPCSPNTEYTLSGGTRYMRIAEYTYDKSFVKTVNSGQSSTPVTIKTGDDGAYLRVSYHDTTMGDAKIQLELGSTATSYAPYFEPIELCKIGDYQDYIYCDRGGDWFIHKEIKKIVFDGNTNWSKHSTTNGNVFMLPSTGLVGYAYNTGTKAPALMDTDTCIALGSQPDSAYGVFGVMGAQQLRLFRGEYDAEYTAEKLKSEMVGHYVCGALVTPTDTEITDSLLLSQLNALFEGGSYEDKTFIKVTATDPNLPGLLYVEAGKNV